MPVPLEAFVGGSRANALDRRGEAIVADEKEESPSPSAPDAGPGLAPLEGLALRPVRPEVDELAPGANMFPMWEGTVGEDGEVLCISPPADAEPAAAPAPDPPAPLV